MAANNYILIVLRNQDFAKPFVQSFFLISFWTAQKHQQYVSCSSFWTTVNGLLVLK